MAMGGGSSGGGGRRGRRRRKGPLTEITAQTARDGGLQIVRKGFQTAGELARINGELVIGDIGPEHALPRMLVIALSDWREARQRGVLNEHQGELLMIRIDRALNAGRVRAGGQPVSPRPPANGPTGPPFRNRPPACSTLQASQ